MNQKAYKNVKYLISIAILLLLLLVLSIKRHKRREAYLQEARIEMKRREDSIAMQKEYIAQQKEKNRRERLAQMSALEMSSTIYAGLNFGDTPQTVEKAMKRNQFIQIPIDNEVEEIQIAKYKAQYYQGKLASLFLYSESDYLLEALYALYSKKYGEGISYGWNVYKWQFSNCNISLERKYRNKYREKDFYNRVLYYGGYEENSLHLTNNDSYLKITYENNKLVQIMKREKFLADSLEKAKRLEANERKKIKEKELAKKLATEIPTNI